MDKTKTIYERLLDVMVEVPAIAKSDRNEHQKFNFRGIDAVVNAVGPALRKHGVMVIPTVLQYDYSVEEFGQNRTKMGHVRVQVQYEFIGLAGDKVIAISVGEATDSGDKGTAKAMSVAFRTALLQTLCLPTDELDPDAYSYERSAPVVDKKEKPQKESAYQKFVAMLNNAPTLAELDIAISHIQQFFAQGNKLRDEEVVALRELVSDMRAKFERGGK